MGILKKFESLIKSHVEPSSLANYAKMGEAPEKTNKRELDILRTISSFNDSFKWQDIRINHVSLPTPPDVIGGGEYNFSIQTVPTGFFSGGECNEVLISVQVLPTLIKALKKAEAEFIANGLLSDSWKQASDEVDV